LHHPYIKEFQGTEDEIVRGIINLLTILRLPDRNIYGW